MNELGSMSVKKFSDNIIIEFSLEKCGKADLKKVNWNRTTIRLDNESIIHERND